tara:strand:- start:2361 stop:2675 length:315 start_codon:yes stop_codon:yes gene_type:complete
MKIILIIIGIILWSISIAIGYVAGFIRGCKIMSNKGEIKSKMEKTLLKDLFGANYINPVMESTYFKEKVESLKGAIEKDLETKELISKPKAKKKSKKAKKNVKK